MKKLFLFLFFLLSLNVFAQDEMDTTFVVNPSGDTVGIIHKRGEQPIIPDYVLQGKTAASPQANLGAKSYADSIQYYQELADRYLISGNNMRSTGKGLMVGGGLGFGLGVMLMIAGEMNTDTDSYGDEHRTSMGDELNVLGEILVLTMPGVFVAGIVTKCVGSGKLRRAKRFNDKALYFQNLQSSFASLKILPVINPVEGSFGGKLALGF